MKLFDVTILLSIAFRSLTLYHLFNLLFAELDYFYKMKNCKIAYLTVNRSNNRNDMAKSSI